MRFIKTYWHLSGGADREEYYFKIRREPLFLFALSTLLLSRQHDVDVYTNEEGRDFVCGCGIRFSKLHIVELQHPSYRSVNDLFVLSQQQEPAVFIGDNLLVTGKVEIGHRPSTVMTLGIYLNSYRLVKSLIKVRRMAGEVPFLDDSLWMNKMAYIDSSLFAIDNGKVLQNYLAEVSEFVERYSSELSGIEQGPVEDLIRQYWLYSYLMAHGVSFETYFKDPLSVVLPRDGFAFSARNIVQDILKLDDFRFGDAQFAVDFFRFFCVHFPESWLAIDKMLSGPVNARKKIEPYKRVRKALERSAYSSFAPDGNWDLLTRREIEKFVSGLEKVGKKGNGSLVQDVFDYERALHKANRIFLRDLAVVRAQQRAAFEQMLKNWDLDEASFAMLKLSVNEYAFFHESCWKWGTFWVEGVDKKMVAELKVIYNLAEEPGYFITAFIPDVETGISNEVNLDRVSVEIIDYLGEGSTLQSLLDGPTGSDREMKGDVPAGAIKRMYVNRAKELLRVNILYINEQ
jgi:hypothetical protein